MRVVLTGGGTGGHIYPAVAIGRNLQARVPGVEILYIGTAKGLEADIVPKEGFEFRTVEVESLPRSLSLKTVRTAFKLLKGLRGARRLLREFKPDVVIGTGGYVCGPVVFSAARLGIPALIHEQNALPGITNKLLARFVNLVMVNFVESKKYFPAKAKVEVTGLPIRPGILNVDKAQGIKALGLDPAKFTILVTGGSRGARSINLAVADVVDKFASRTDVQVVVATGTATYEEFINRAKQKGFDPEKTDNIIVKPYIYNMAEALAAADLCICRAGAAFLSELLVKAKPSILVPYPFAAENHQEYNAKAVAEQGAAWMILDKDLSGQILAREVENLLNHPEVLSKMSECAGKIGKPEATELIGSLVLSVADKTKA